MYKAFKGRSELTIIGSEIIDEDLIEIICSKENEIKKGIIEAIEIGFDYAQEEMKGIEELQEELKWVDTIIWKMDIHREI